MSHSRGRAQTTRSQQARCACRYAKGVAQIRSIPTQGNKGKVLGQKPRLKVKDIWAVRIRLQLTHRFRKLALLNLAIDSKLRGCDPVGPHIHTEGCETQRSARRAGDQIPTDH